MRRGRYSEALPLFLEAVGNYESLPEFTQQFIACLSSLGEIYVLQGLSEKAVIMAHRAMALSSMQSKKQNSIFTLSRIGNLFSNLGEHGIALNCTELALDLEGRACGKHTFHYMVILERIGSEHSRLDKPEVALSWFQRARAGYEKLNMTSTLPFAQLLLNVGTVYERLSNLTEALSHYTRAEAVYRGNVPPDHPDITGCTRGIASVNAALGNTDASTAALDAAESSARRSQVQCAAAGCPRKLKADGSSLDQCGGCKRCYYCSVKCQTEDWKAGHKAECKALRGGK